MKQKLCLTWKNPDNEKTYKIGNLFYDNDKYTFKYSKEVNEAIKVGFRFYPGFYDINKEYKSSRLFANIEARFPNPKRPDYLEILKKYGLNKFSSSWDILKATKGKLITDDYEFIET